ncbi:winged helix-turn-helix transcriptional regulator [Acidianus infernus]|uniref:Winged helix-turn-helix transcriptional regulator n=1 Tax=Acidianus infernus TaxID=12915 RepID=A0A6A9QFA0_ACIIN|nr:winged helix-turn-helix domain-containing protein [Acidianus infernus]MCY0874326.1 winged helix-turn-helix domain-containing protein [Acidianus infernus]MUM63890.1 winged helix-turn-helix transcriptional regulator [Acidianus infernus]
MESNISSYENLIQEKILEKGDEGISQQELAKSVGLSTRELSMIVKRLIEKKVIVKRTVKENGKSVVKLFATKSSSINNDIYINLDSVREIPCFSCKLLYKCNNGAHVNPGSCSKLSEWILYLVG